jgi:cytochrome c biogenesis protein CcmG/thiol:disulfide interchange protein DsbE
VLIAALGSLACAAGPPPPSAQSPILGRAMPEFKRRAVDGRAVDTQALRGQVVVVKFFAKYCEPCKKTLPAAERIHQADPGVAFIGVAEDEYAADVDHMIQTYRLTFPVVHDRGNVLSGRFRVSEMPISFVVDRAGTIRWVGAEQHTEADLERAIAAAKN